MRAFPRDLLKCPHKESLSVQRNNPSNSKQLFAKSIDFGRGPRPPFHTIHGKIARTYDDAFTKPLNLRRYQPRRVLKGSAMATFSVNGYQLRSNAEHLVHDVQNSQMQIVSPLGMSTLDCSYVDHGPGNAEVALADYNLLLNGTHLNDGQLPHRIELFDLTWGTQNGSHVSRVLNLAFKEGEGWRDEVFAIAESPLPSIVSAAQANAFLGASRFSLVDTSESAGIFQIQLDQMPDVDVRGVLLKLFTGAPEEDDSFEFMQEFDALPADATMFDVAVSGGLVASKQESALMPDPILDQDPEDIADPGFDELSF